MQDFIVSSYLEMLNELARQIGEPELARSDETQRPHVVSKALQTERALIIFDNLESMPEIDRNRLFEFLNHLPLSCKAIATSRRRTDVGAPILRLDKLHQPAALKFIASLAEHNTELRKAKKADRVKLYEETGGNPLLIRWVAGQLGRRRTMAAALKFLAAAPSNNDPVNYILGDLAKNFTRAEVKVLVAVSHFTLPTEVKFIAEVSGLSFQTTETALEDLAARALVSPGDAEDKTYILLPQVANFLRRARADAVAKSAEQITSAVNKIIAGNSDLIQDQNRALEEHWPLVAASLPLFLAGPSDQLKAVFKPLGKFLNYAGRWDEALSLSLRSEEKAVKAKDYFAAGDAAYQAGYMHYQRREGSEISACANRVETYWGNMTPNNTGRALIARLRGLGYQLAGNDAAALTAFEEGLELLGGPSKETANVAAALCDISNIKQNKKNYSGATLALQEALRIAKKIGSPEAIANYTGNLAGLALVQGDTATAVKLALQALPISEEQGRRELVAHNCSTLAYALLRQGKKAEALGFAQRSAAIYEQFSPQEAVKIRAVCAKCVK